jgi:hypothetical protein
MPDDHTPRYCPRMALMIETVDDRLPPDFASAVAGDDRLEGFDATAVGVEHMVGTVADGDCVIRLSLAADGPTTCSLADGGFAISAAMDAGPGDVVAVMLDVFEHDGDVDAVNGSTPAPADGDRPRHGRHAAGPR